MLGFNGVEAAIAIDGVELPRYRVQHDNLNNTVTCWIPSEAGKVQSMLSILVETLFINVSHILGF